MNYQLSEYLVIETVAFFQRVFRYNSQWLNANIELVQVASGSTLQVFEAFSEAEETYPSIAIASTGGQIQHLSMNNAQSSSQQSELIISERSSITKRISDTESLAVQLPASAIRDLTIRGLSAYYGWTGVGDGGDDVTAVLYRDYTTLPVQVASASLPGRETVDFQRSYAEFTPYPEMSGTDYWVVFSATAASPYYVGLDATDDSTMYRYITSSGTAPASGSLAGTLTLPATFTIGGAYNSKIGVRIRAKNSSKVALQLAELVAQYCEYAKHAYISRAATATDGMKSVYLDSGVAEFTKKGIYIKDVAIGAVDVQPRGQNDNIFSILVSIDCFTEWQQSFAAETLDPNVDDFTIDITSFN